MGVGHSSIRVFVGNNSSASEKDAIQSDASWNSPSSFTPLIDIHDSPEGLILEADLPGTHEQNLTIQLEHNVLTLHARIESTVPDGAQLLHEEYRVGDYYRSFILNDEVDRDNIKAELSQGVLRLTLPKAERRQPRRIEIKS